MKIAFLTTQTTSGSTVIGRVLPLARELANAHDIHVIVHEPITLKDARVNLHVAGKNPFIQTTSGKKRLKGLALVARLKWNAWLQASELFRIKPDVVVVVKSLPQSVLAALFARYIFLPRAKFILDVDDFELTANALTSWFERAAVHWAQRSGARLASSIVVASPFLQDYFQQLAPKKRVTLIPTGHATGPGAALPHPTASDYLLGLDGAAPAAPPVAQTKTILYLGSVSITSGHRVDLLPDILEQVCKVMPDARLTIAGSGDDVESLKKMFAAKNLSAAVTWHGRYTAEDAAKLIADADVVIDPIDGSITNRAKSSSRVINSIAAGKPVVTSNVGIRSQMIPSQFHKRFFAEPGRASDYATQCISLLQQPLTSAEKTDLKTSAMRYTWDVLGQEYVKLLT